jgi:site-specific DNA-methyltransferase (adenine-specific)
MIDLPKRWLVWHYTNKNSARAKFWQRSHESILVIWKSDRRIFNLDDVREPYTEAFVNNAAGRKRAGTKGRFTRKGQETTYIAHEKGALPRDVIKIPALAGGAGRSERFFLCKTCNALYALSKRQEHTGHEMAEHPTQKPKELCKRLILAAKPSWKGQLVVPFTGTGAEVLTGQELEMKVIGFDINPDYVQMANLLLQKGYPQCS